MREQSAPRCIWLVCGEEVPTFACAFLRLNCLNRDLKSRWLATARVVRRKASPSVTLSALCHSKCKWKSKRQEVRGRSKRLAQLSPARIGGLRTKIWAGVVPPASGTPTQLAESVDPTEGHSLRVPPPPPPAAVRVWSATWRRRQPGGYGTLRLYVGRGYDGRPAGYVPNTCPCSSLHSTSSPHTLGSG